MMADNRSLISQLDVMKHIKLAIKRENKRTAENNIWFRQG